MVPVGKRERQTFNLNVVPELFRTETDLHPGCGTVAGRVPADQSCPCLPLADADRRGVFLQRHRTGERHRQGFGLRGAGAAAKAALAGNRPRRSVREPAGWVQSGLPEAGNPGIVVGAEEISRHRVMSKTGSRERSRPPFAFSGGCRGDWQYSWRGERRKSCRGRERACFRRGLRLSISPSWLLFAEILFEADFSKPFYNKVRK